MTTDDQIKDEKLQQIIEHVKFTYSNLLILL